jgi:hypothetical protein
MYDVCFSDRYKFVPHPRYRQITLEIQDAMRRCDSMCDINVFRSAKRHVADMMKGVFARFVEMDFDLAFIVLVFVIQLI